MLKEALTDQEVIGNKKSNYKSYGVKSEIYFTTIFL